MVLWGVAFVPTRESLAGLRDFRDQKGITYPLALDVNRDMQPYNSGYAPTLYIVDRKGVIRYAKVGFDKAGVINKIEELLDQEPIGPTFELRLNKMDLTPYMPGEIMTLYADVTNPGDAVAVNIFIAVEMFGQYYFWPSYGAMMTPTPFTLPDNMMLLGYVLESVPINEVFPPPGTFKWYGVLANPLSGEWITDPSILTWTVGSETP